MESDILINYLKYVSFSNGGPNGLRIALTAIPMKCL